MRATALFFGIIALGGCAAGDTGTSPSAAPPDAAAPAAPEPALAVASNSRSAKARMPVPFMLFSVAAMSNAQGQPLIYVLGGARAVPASGRHVGGRGRR